MRTWRQVKLQSVAKTRNRNTSIRKRRTRKKVRRSENLVAMIVQMTATKDGPTNTHAFDVQSLFETSAPKCKRRRISSERTLRSRHGSRKFWSLTDTELDCIRTTRDPQNSWWDGPATAVFVLTSWTVLGIRHPDFTPHKSQ